MPLPTVPALAVGLSAMLPTVTAPVTMASAPSAPSTSVAASTAPSTAVPGTVTTRSASAHVAAASASRASVRRLVAATARRYGVDPRLALAIAHQESGFRQDARSAVGAIGVMQVMPANTTWVSGMAGRRLDLTVTRDNVTAGVVILRWLTRHAPSLDRAIGGYYQGLPSIMHRGPYADTVRYTRNVRALMKRY